MADEKHDQETEPETAPVQAAPVVTDGLDDLEPAEDQLADVKGGRAGGGPPSFS